MCASVLLPTGSNLQIDGSGVAKQSEPRHDKTNKTAQSDQSLHCPHEETLGP